MGSPQVDLESAKALAGASAAMRRRTDSDEFMQETKASGVPYSSA